MARTKKIKEEVVEVAEKSVARIAFESFLETYKKQNPAKYEAKKEELLTKLNNL